MWGSVLGGASIILRINGLTIVTDELDDLDRQLYSVNSEAAAPRAEPLHVLMLPDLDPAERIGEFSGNPNTRTFANP